MTEQQMPARIWVYESLIEDGLLDVGCKSDTPYVRADIAERMAGALERVRGIISEAAMTGFNWTDGDWPNRLFASQADTSAALSAFKDSAQDRGAS